MKSKKRFSEISESRIQMFGKISNSEEDLSNLDCFTKENVDYIVHDVLKDFTKDVMRKYELTK